MLEHIIELILPTIISACELMGIFVVTVSALIAFWRSARGWSPTTPATSNSTWPTALPPVWNSKWPLRS